MDELELLEALFEHAPVAYLVIACAGGLIRRLNVRAIDLFGWPREALVDRSLLTLVARADVPRMLEHLGGCGATSATARTLEVGVESAGRSGRALFTIRGGQVVGDDAVCLVTAVDVTEQRRSERLAARVAELSGAAWLPVDEAVAQIARLAVPDLADLCCVDLVENGALRARAAIAHRDPLRIDRVRDAEERWGLLPNVSYARLQALMTRKPQVIPQVTPGYWQLAAADPDHLEALVLLVLRSWACVPLVDPADDAVVGVLRLATTGRTFDASTLALLEEFGHAAAVTLVRARRERERLWQSRQQAARMSSASVALEEASRGLTRLGSRGAPARGPVARTLTQLAADLSAIARELKEPGA